MGLCVTKGMLHAECSTKAERDDTLGERVWGKENLFVSAGPLPALRDIENEQAKCGRVSDEYEKLFQGPLHDLFR